MNSYLFYNGNILTMDDTNPNPEAVIVQGSKILATGLFSDLKKMSDDETELIDLKGRVLLPGLIDGHTHFFELCKTKIAVDLSPATNLDEVKDILIKYRENMSPELKWVGGSGWNQNIYPNLDGFNKFFLDEIFPDIPVSLESKDFHSKWCNSLALERAGITKDSPDPEGGSYGHFDNGELDGFTYEKAWAVVDRVVPPYPKSLVQKAIIETINDCYEQGLVGINSMENPRKYHDYQELFKENPDIEFNICWHIPSDNVEEYATELFDKHIYGYSGDERLKIGGMKIFTDGSLGSHSALMLDPIDETGNRGSTQFTRYELLNEIIKGEMYGISSTIHAIGDKACHDTITAIDFALEELDERIAKGSFSNDVDGAYLRSKIHHRIEHLQCVRPEEYKLLKKNNILVCANPIHLRYDIDTIAKHWQHVAEYTYNFRDLIDYGIEVAFGSDAPVEIINPFAAIYAAVERRPMNDPKRESWRPEQKITAMEALKAFTYYAAKSSQSHHTRGLLKAGYQADMIIIDDFTKLPNEFWLECKPYLTMIRGKKVYSR